MSWPSVGASRSTFASRTGAAAVSGALVDVNGNLLGINTAIYSRTGGNQGITAGYGQLLTLSGMGPGGSDLWLLEPHAGAQPGMRGR